jgi:hypothetical protein
MGVTLTAIDDTTYRCTVDVWTVGYVFLVAECVVKPNDTCGIPLQPVWYDDDFNFEGDVGKFTRR